jgi:acetyl-CoA/propionyl-CoA carboxylase biotin carboxyl carrier protein
VLRTFVEIDGKRHELGLPAALLRGVSLTAAGPADESPRPSEAADPQAVLTPVAGNLHTWVVADGESVSAGQVIAVVEAMKMETSILAPCAGQVQIGQQAGAYFEAGSVIGRIKTAD